ncbi:MAG TPA: cytochrome c biogenesis CcdA family protein [Mycobacteriales bacterium]|jgi:cytochrome c-type biogenesis protein|nr:cytochrome c biogenesis CcdA family protein [Mycobacteriales bacterium]
MTALGGVQDTVLSGSLLLALPVALLAGLVSFLSPCVLPLVPGYLSYITGLTGADLEEASAGTRHRGRVLLGGLLFVLGFSVVFVSGGALFGAFGHAISDYQPVLMRVFGAVTIVLGLAFMGLLGWLPFLSRDVRVHATPRTGLAGAPFLGFVFGLGWTPCAGPTLGTVLGLSATSATAVRGAVLSLAYCLGLGLPFVGAGLAFQRSMRAFAVVKRHYALVTRLGGAFLVAVGVLLVTGLWADLVGRMQGLVSGWTTPV